MVEKSDHKVEVDAETPDWSREKPVQFWDPSRELLLAIRRYQYWQKRAGISGSFYVNGFYCVIAFGVW